MTTFPPPQLRKTQPLAIVFLSGAKDLACLLFTPLRTGPPAIVFLSEAKDLACWLLNIAVWRHFASIQKSRSFASLRMTIQRGLIYGKRWDAAWLIAILSLFPHCAHNLSPIVFLSEAKDLACWLLNMHYDDNEHKYKRQDPSLRSGWQCRSVVPLLRLGWQYKKV